MSVVFRANATGVHHFKRVVVGGGGGAAKPRSLKDSMHELPVTSHGSSHLWLTVAEH